MFFLEAVETSCGDKRQSKAPISKKNGFFCIPKSIKPLQNDQTYFNNVKAALRHCKSAENACFMPCRPFRERDEISEAAR